MSKALKIAYAVIRGIVAGLCVILLVYNLYVIISRYGFGNPVPTVFGYGGAQIVSGSMDDGTEDAIKVHDFVIIHARDDYEVGDIVTYIDNYGDATTHRIIEKDGDTFLTKGDNPENAVDPPITKEKIVGKVIAVWRGVGEAIEFIKGPYGLMAILFAGVVIWFAGDIIGILTSGKKDEEE